MPVKDFFIYIFFLARGDLELNLYFSLFTGNGLDLDYVCMFVNSKFPWTRMSRPPPLGPTPNCVRNRGVVWVLKRAQHTWTLQLSNSFFAFLCCFFFTGQGSNVIYAMWVSCVYWMIVSSLQKWFPTNLTLVAYPVIYLQSFIRPKWCIFLPSSVW